MTTEDPLSSRGSSLSGVSLHRNSSFLDNVVGALREGKGGKSYLEMRKDG